jgi:uncharacterized protein
MTTELPHKRPSDNPVVPTQALTDFVAVVRACDWFMRVLACVRDENIRDAWVGAGVVRDLIWGELYGSGFQPADVHDVDVPFFDPADLAREYDDRVTRRLTARCPAVPWQARNQAAVHTWYACKFGGDAPEPLTSIEDAIRTWPETATAIAVRLADDGAIEICAPFGVTDLMEGVWRRNPRRVSLDESLARLRRHSPGRRWPGVRVIAPA